MLAKPQVHRRKIFATSTIAQVPVSRPQSLDILPVFGGVVFKSGATQGVLPRQPPNFLEKNPFHFSRICAYSRFRTVAPFGTTNLGEVRR